jgi:hypothetical protein
MNMGKNRGETEEEPFSNGKVILIKHFVVLDAS